MFGFTGSVPRNRGCILFLECALLSDVVLQLADGNTNLLHGVTVTNGDTVVSLDSLVANSLEVHSDTQRCADLVLTAITLTDRTGIVKVHHKVLTQLSVDLLCRGAELLVGRCVANAHTIIKVFQVIILLPFSKLLVKLTYFFIPGDDEKVSYRENLQLKYIGDKVVFNPATAVVDVIKELDRMAALASENLNRAMNALITLDEEDIEEVYVVENNINFLNHSITDYLVKISRTTLPIEDMKSIGGLFHVANDIERIGDHAENVAECAKRRKESDTTFSKEAQKELGDMLNMVNTIVRFSIEMFSHNSEEHLQDILNLEEAIDEKERELQKRHVERLTQNQCTPEAGMLFSDIVSGLERVADHATNIAFSILDDDTLKMLKN